MIPVMSRTSPASSSGALHPALYHNLRLTVDDTFMKYHFVWLIWSSAFLLPWIALYLTNPLEELLFGAAFGLYWSGVYEHFTWTKTVPHSGST